MVDLGAFPRTRFVVKTATVFSSAKMGPVLSNQDFAAFTVSVVKTSISSGFFTVTNTAWSSANPTIVPSSGTKIANTP